MEMEAWKAFGNTMKITIEVKRDVGDANGKSWDDDNDDNDKRNRDYTRCS